MNIKMTALNGSAVALTLCVATAWPVGAVRAEEAPAAPVAAAPAAAPAAAEKPAEPSPVAKKAYEELLAALQSGEYQKFIALGDDDLKASVRETPFDAVTEIYASRLKKGFDASYFGTMKKNGSEIYFWKLVFKDGSDDLLVQIGIKKEKLNNFFLL